MPEIDWDMAVQRYAIACKTYSTCSLQLAGTQNDAGDVRSHSPCSILSIYEKLDQSTPWIIQKELGKDFTFGSDCTVPAWEGWKCTSKERSSIEITGVEQDTSFRNVPKYANSHRGSHCPSFPVRKGVRTWLKRNDLVEYHFCLYVNLFFTFPFECLFIRSLLRWRRSVNRMAMHQTGERLLPWWLRWLLCKCKSEWHPKVSLFIHCVSMAFTVQWQRSSDSWKISIPVHLYPETFAIWLYAALRIAPQPP